MLDSVKQETRTSHDSYWNQFSAFCAQNALHDPSDAIDEAPNHVANRIATRFEGGSKSGSCDNMRSVIRSHCKRFVKCPDGWAFDNYLKKFIGDPYDIVDVTELIKGACNASHSRRDTTKRVAPMTMIVFCQLCEFLKIHIVTNPNVADEGFHLMAGCTRFFYT